MPSVHDGPASPLFEPVPFEGNVAEGELAGSRVSEVLRGVARFAPQGRCTGWGLPFEMGRPLLAEAESFTLELGPLRARWLVFCHSADVDPPETDADGFERATRGRGRLGEHVASYTVLYVDGSEERRPIRHRHEIGMVQRAWGETCFEAVQFHKPHPIAAVHEQESRPPFGMRQLYWGFTQTRVRVRDIVPLCTWLWAFENPHPRRAIAGLRVEPARGRLLLFGISAGRCSSHPLRWGTRRKALLTLRQGESPDLELDERGLIKDLQLDLGQVISAQPRAIYPNESWEKGYERQLPEIRRHEVLVEYTAHPDAHFHLAGGRTVPVAGMGRDRATHGLRAVAPATQRVRLRVLEQGTRRPVPVRLHAHGEAGEYLAPVDRHRIPNPSWFEDYSTDHVCFDPSRASYHHATYIDGEATLDLPLGHVFLELSKGFEIEPVRKRVRISRSTRRLTVTLRRVLPWRERGWVTADTHVHFLSPRTAQLEGAAEGVNVINLLASQWGELMTNVGDFDGRTTFGSREAGGDGEWLVRVGSENRQHVLGHVSLLGYSGDLIAPMCSGGPDEAALGDPVGALLTEWARECRRRGGIVVFPHFPEPRAENAAALVHGDVDAVEMCSIGNEFGGIDPFSLSDWYRYLNCGYFYPCVGGTDKMAATTAVGTIRTYARLPRGRRFSYESWKQAVRSGDTFVTYGPLLDFRVEGRPPGRLLRLGAGGGTVDVEWEVASVTLPMTRVELIVNGEILESRSVGPSRARGHWRVPLARSSWLALLVRGRRPDRPEVIGAHSSPVRVRVRGTRFYAKADALTILEQIEGALAYLDTVGTRADDRAHKRMRLVLSSAHRKLHNEMHRRGLDHVHTSVHEH